MKTENSVFIFSETEKQLFHCGRDSQFDTVTAKVIETEMQFRKNHTVLRIHQLSQEGLEYFVSHYGSTYRVIYLANCTKIKDFSPLGDLAGLEALCIEQCRGVSDLWDLSKNQNLKILSIRAAKRITQNPHQLQLSKSLEEIRFWNEGIDRKYKMDSLSCFSGIQSLRRIDLNGIALNRHNLGVLNTLPNLEEFHFDAHMLKAEEIRWIRSNYPNLHGQNLDA